MSNMALEPIPVPASRRLQNPSNCLGKSIQVTMSEIFAWLAKKFQLMTFVLRGAFFPYTEGTTPHRHLPLQTQICALTCHMDVEETLTTSNNMMDIDRSSPPPYDGMDVDEPLLTSYTSDRMTVDKPSPPSYNTIITHQMSLTHEAMTGVHDSSKLPSYRCCFASRFHSYKRPITKKTNKQDRLFVSTRIIIRINTLTFSIFLQENGFWWCIYPSQCSRWSGFM
jgi:hypothetical protein